jgi:transcriptional regulator
LRQRKQLFKEWFFNHQDFQQVALKHQREHKETNKTSTKMTFRTRAELITLLGEEAADELIRAKTASGQFRRHPELPNRAELIQYLCHSTTEVSNATLASATTALNFESAVEGTTAADLVQHFTPAITVPGISVPFSIEDCAPGSSGNPAPAGHEDSGKGKGKHGRGGKNGAGGRKTSSGGVDNVELTAKEPIDKAKDGLKQTQRLASTARTLQMSLRALKFASELTGQLEQFSSSIEKEFSALQTVVMTGANSEADYTKHLELLQRRDAWFRIREKASKALLSAANAKFLPPAIFTFTGVKLKCLFCLGGDRVRGGK